jgi:hypothetical protein
LGERSFDFVRFADFAQDDTLPGLRTQDSGLRTQDPNAYRYPASSSSRSTSLSGNPITLK